jgi:hypothetical protein
VSLATEDAVDRLHERQDDREHLKILDWLAPNDYGLNRVILSVGDKKEQVFGH